MKDPKACASLRGTCAKGLNRIQTFYCHMEKKAKEKKGKKKKRRKGKKEKEKSPNPVPYAKDVAEAVCSGQSSTTSPASDPQAHWLGPEGERRDIHAATNLISVDRADKRPLRT